MKKILSLLLITFSTFIFAQTTATPSKFTVDEDGTFSGYFSPNDYRQAMSKIDTMPAIRALE